MARTSSGGSPWKSPLRGPLAVAAIVFACGGVAAGAVAGHQAGRAHGHKPAAKGLRHVRFADKANRADHVARANDANHVDNFKVAFRPAPYTLLALDSSGHFPDAVKPPGVALGPPGRPGASGNFTSQIVTAKAGDKSCLDTSITGTNATDQTKPAIGCAACPISQPVVGGGYKDISSQQLPDGTRTGHSQAPGSYDAVVWNAPIQQKDGSTAWEAELINVPPKNVDPSKTPPAGLVILQVYAICGSF